MTFSIFNRSAGDHIVRFSKHSRNNKTAEFFDKFVKSSALFGGTVCLYNSLNESYEQGHSIKEGLPRAVLITAGGTVSSGVIACSLPLSIISVFAIWLMMRK